MECFESFFIVVYFDGGFEVVLLFNILIIITVTVTVIVLVIVLVMVVVVCCMLCIVFTQLSSKLFRAYHI